MRTMLLAAAFLAAVARIPDTAAAGSSTPEAPETCPPAAGELSAVVRLIDPSTLALADGTELRFSGLLPPSIHDIPGKAKERLHHWTPERDARQALEQLTQSGRIRLSQDGATRDRYGRRVAHAHTEDANGMRTWLQGALVEEGHARVAPLPERLHCLQALLQREAVARATRKGLWQNPAYAIRDARDTQTLTQLTGTFQIIEGWVVATGASRREVFLNFGRNWRWDFTAAVVLPRGGDSAALSTRLKALEGRYVRVRGWLVKRNGPFIALAGAEAIEELPEGLGSADMR